MGMDYIRADYGVPAKRGARVKYTGGVDAALGTITGSLGHYLRIRLDGSKRSNLYHPTWEIEYVTPNLAMWASSSLPHRQT